MKEQLLELANGAIRSADDILEAVKAGYRVDFRTPHINGLGECANPVVGAVRTAGTGVRILFEDGRSVCLTTGHVLPLDEEWVDWNEKHGGGYHSRTWEFPVRQQWIVRAGDVRPGMKLLDGTVASVTGLGNIEAVRLWTAHPAWIRTACGLRIGTRWHEIVHAWAEVEEERITDEEGDRNFDLTPEIVPVSACGWLWGTGKKNPYSFSESWQLHGAQDDEGRFNPIPAGRWSAERPVALADLGSAYTVRETLRARQLSALRFPELSEPPHTFQERRKEERLEGIDMPLQVSWKEAFGAKLARARLAPTRKLALAWSKPRDLESLLITGSEIVESPILTNHQVAGL